MSERTYLTVEDLKTEIIKLYGIESLPKRGSGSGKNGNIIKKDLIKVLETSKKNIKKTIVSSPKLKPKENVKENVKDVTKILYTDIWTTIVKSLDIKDILRLCATNKELEDKICKNHNYWLIRLKEDLNIPNNWVTLNQLEYKNKTPFQIYNYVTRKYEKIYIGGQSLESWPRYLMGYEMAIKELDCSRNKLSKLPSLPMCKRLWCYSNRLTGLSNLSECVELYCSDNELTSLPDLSKCVILICDVNRLTSLPELPECTRLWCSNNRLSALPDLPKLKDFMGGNNLALLKPVLH